MFNPEDFYEEADEFDEIFKKQKFDKEQKEILIQNLVKDVDLALMTYREIKEDYKTFFYSDLDTDEKIKIVNKTIKHLHYIEYFEAIENLINFYECLQQTMHIKEMNFKKTSEDYKHFPNYYRNRIEYFYDFYNFIK